MAKLIVFCALLNKILFSILVPYVPTQRIIENSVSWSYVEGNVRGHEHTLFIT